MVTEKEKLELAEEECKVKEKRITFMQYVNTTLLAVMSFSSVLIFAKINSYSDQLLQVKEQLTGIEKEQVRFRTIQDINSTAIFNSSVRISELETDNRESLEKWVEDNFIRKSQK